LPEISGSWCLSSGVGTQIRTADTSLQAAKSVVARKSPAAVDWMLAEVQLAGLSSGIMVNQVISIPLDPATATAYESASDRERRQLQLLLRLRLRELTGQPPRPLADVLDEAARAAAARGLTGDILRDLLADD